MADQSEVTEQDPGIGVDPAPPDPDDWLHRILPIIRVRKARPWTIVPRRHEIVGLYRDELVIVRKPISAPIPDSIYEVEGAGSLKALGSGPGTVRSVPIEDIKRLTSLRKSRLRETDGLHLRGEGGSVRFRIRNVETPNLYRALEQLLGERFRRRSWPSMRGMLARLFPFLALLLLAVSIGTDATAIGPVAWLTVVALVVGLFDIVPGSSKDAGRRKARSSKDLSGREPWRMRTLGYLLSALGAGLILVTFCIQAYDSSSLLLNPIGAGLPWYVKLLYFTVIAFATIIIPSVMFGRIGQLVIFLASVGFVISLVFLAVGLLLQPTLLNLLGSLFAISPYLALILISTGRGLVARNARTTLAGDQRPPILYLRSFEDDRDDDLTPESFLSKLYGIVVPENVRRLPLWQRVLFELHPLRLLRSLTGRITLTTESQLARYFRELGPFIAVGKPGERLATTGADRVYVKDAEWRQTVLDFIDQSRFVVLQAAATEGFLWEVRNVLKRAGTEKILFCLSNFRQRQDDYENFLLTARDVEGWSFPPGIGNLDEPQFLFFDADRRSITHALSYHSPILWPLLGQLADLRHTLAGFVSRQPAGAGDTYTPRSFPGHTLASVLLFLTLFPILTGIAFYGMYLITAQFFPEGVS